MTLREVAAVPCVAEFEGVRCDRYEDAAPTAGSTAPDMMASYSDNQSADVNVPTAAENNDVNSVGGCQVCGRVAGLRTDDRIDTTRLALLASSADTVTRERAMPLARRPRPPLFINSNR